MSARALAVAAMAALLHLAAPAAAADAFGVKQVSTSPPTRKITFDEILEKKIKLVFTDQAGGTVDVYPLDSTPETRAANTCRLPVSSGSQVDIDLPKPAGEGEACQSLAAKLLRAEAVKYAVSPTGSPTYAILEFAPPATKLGELSTDITVARIDQHAIGSVVNLPAYATPIGAPGADPFCHVLLGQWYHVKCDKGVLNLDAPLPAAIESAWDQGKAPTLYANVATAAAPGGEWRAFPLIVKPKDGGKDPGSLAERCHKVAQEVKSASTDPSYYVCVDAFPDKRGMVTLECDPKVADGKPPCRPAGDVVRVGRGFTVQAWYAAGTVADISFGGAAGSDAPVYDPNKPAAKAEKPSIAAETARGADYKITARTFGPRKAGTAAKLSVSVQRMKKEDGTLSDYFKVEQEFTLEAYYRGAIRLGFGYTYMPWARTVGIQTARNGQKYAAVTQDGLSDYELVAGFSYFFCDMPDNQIKLCAAMGARLGVLGVNAAVKVATSLMAGPEIAIGRDFSVGAYGGVHTHEYPDAAFTPGKLVRADVIKTETHFGLTPAFGLVVNFTPSVLKSVGLTP
jgi:hypothetical protein